jgi:hypothetical protein
MFSSQLTMGNEEESSHRRIRVFRQAAYRGHVSHRILASALALGVVATGATALSMSAANAEPGSATAKVTVGSKTYKLSGGACQVTRNSVNVGIGGSPNSLGLHAAVHKGKFTNAQIGLILGGKPLALTTDTGTVTSKGGTFKGTDVVSQSPVKGSFTC